MRPHKVDDTTERQHGDNGRTFGVASRFGPVFGEQVSGGSVASKLVTTPKLALITLPQYGAEESLEPYARVTGLAAISPPTGGLPKRALDIAIAGTALALLAPVMAAVAVAIRFTGSGGPALYAHPRIGQGGRTFNCLKFRTMATDGDQILERHLALNPAARREWEETRKLTNDPRITPLGHILRKTSLDELPQLINVLRGDMSCVGPRPIVAAELARYGVHARHYLKARPGLTGVWQTQGRSSTDYKTRVAMDTLYVRKWSLLRDLKILLATIPALLRFNDAK